MPVFEPSAMATLRTHHWPGNVRELEHWVESAVVLSPDGRIEEELLPQSRRPAPSESVAETLAAGVSVPHGLSLDDAMQRYIEATVRECGGNKTEASRRLGVGRNTVARALKTREPT
jgi:Nif-specific regulatory protein